MGLNGTIVTFRKFLILWNVLKEREKKVARTIVLMLPGAKHIT